MIIGGDKKKTVSIILSQMGKPGKEVEAKNEEKIGGSGPLKLIAQDFLKAIEDKSAVDLESAMEALCDYIEVKDLEQDAKAEEAEAE